MNILYHHRTQGAGVEAVHIMGMVSGLRNLGHHVTILGPPGTNPAENPKVSPESGRLAGASFWRIVSEHLPEFIFELLEIGYNFYSLIKLLIFLGTNRVDCIYERYSLFQFGGVLAARIRNVPIALEINDSAVVERVRPLRNKAMAIWLEKRIFQSADLLLTISNYFKDTILSYGLEGEKIFVIPNAINPEWLDAGKNSGQTIRQKYGLQGSFIIGLVGYFVPWHGVLFLLDVFAKLVARADSVHLLLVGDGPERGAIEERVRDMDLRDKVTITGNIRHEDIPAHIQSFDVAVMPDANEYCSPMKMFEYMGMAKAIVAPSYSPVEEILKDRRNALLFEPKDAQGLYRALETLIDDGELRWQLGENGRHDVLSKHTWRNNALLIQRELNRLRNRIASWPLR